MANSIDNVSGNPLNSAERTSRVKEIAGKSDKDVDETKSQSAGQQTETDEIVLTDSAKRLQAVVQQLDAVPVTDKAKIADIQAKIADGSFEVNAEQIAEKLMATDKLLT